MTDPKHTDTSRSGDLVERLPEKLDRYSDVRGLTREGAIRRLLVLHDDCWDLIYDNENKADRIEALEAEVERLRELLDAWLGLAREHLDTELAGRTFEALERTRK